MAGARFPSRVRLAGIGLVVFVVLLLLSRTNAWRDFGYLTRPLWDKDTQFTFTTVKEHYVRDTDMPVADWCKLHGWMERAAPARVFDAILFSVELDILELRLRELWDVVHTFVIVESNTTFTGQPKPAFFLENRERFAWAESKIHYKLVAGRPLGPNESPFINEGQLRNVVKTALSAVGAHTGDLIIAADADEIPRASTMELLRLCDFGEPAINIEMRTYMYSFVYPIEPTVWRAQVWSYGVHQYSRWANNPTLLADAGWHCSFCFRRLSDFRFKMRAYSHADRANQAYLLSDDHIQHAICTGTDLFDMYPEAYSYLDLLRWMRPIPETKSYVDVPRGLVSHPERFAFLLPGGCKREP